MSDNKYSKMTVAELFDAHHWATSPVDKAYLKMTLSKCADDGSKEAKRYIEMINKR